MSAPSVAEKGGPGSGFRGHRGRPGQRGGSTAADGPMAGSHERALRAWVSDLTDGERQAISSWGQSGAIMRRVQAGDAEEYLRARANMWPGNGTILPGALQEVDWARDRLPDWESAIAKGVPWKGILYRGMSEVPESTIATWTPGATITLRNDQSASRDADYVNKHYAGMGTRYAVTGEPAAGVQWRVRQHSGVDLGGTTHVYYGDDVQLGGVDESEVVMRKGTSYRVLSRRRVPGQRYSPDVWQFDLEELP